MSSESSIQFHQPQKHDEKTAKAFRLLAKFQEESKLRLKAIADEMGFSSYEEFDDHIKQDSRRIHAGFLETLAESGTTEEEWYRNHPQRWTPKVSQFCLPMVPQAQCNCLEHLIPSFCPQNLVDHCSMDEPDFIEAQELQQRQLIANIEIRPDDVSKRMPQEILERHWDMESQKVRMELAPWFKGDVILQRIADASTRSSTELSNGSCPRTESRGGANTIEHTITGPTSSRVQRARHVQSSAQMSKKQKAKVNTKSKPAMRSEYTSNVFRAHERRLGKTGIHKSASQPAMRTRSHNVTKFYELNADGVVISHHNFHRPR